MKDRIGQFTDSLRVLLVPDRTFARVLARRDVAAAAVTMGISAAVMSAGGLALFKTFLIPSLTVSLLRGAVVIAAIWAGSLLVCTAATVLLDAMFLLTMKADGNPLAGDRRAHWCCRACVIPWWLLFFCLLAWLPRISAVSLSVIIAAALRLIDVEARLLRQVYRLPLMQAYVIVLMETVFVLFGVAIGMRLPAPPALHMPRMMTPLPGT